LSLPVSGLALTEKTDYFEELAGHRVRQNTSCCIEADEEDTCLNGSKQDFRD
jgi:hypothetical protein